MYATSLHLRLGVKDGGKLSSSISCINTSSIDCPGFILFLRCVNFYLICCIFLIWDKVDCGQACDVFNPCRSWCMCPCTVATDCGRWCCISSDVKPGQDEKGLFFITRLKVDLTCEKHAAYKY